MRTIILGAAIVSAMALLGCEVSKEGARCDGFFSNGCKKPLECVDDGDKKECLKPCDTSLKCTDAVGCCDTGYTCEEYEMEITKNGVSTGIKGPTEKYCVKK